MDVIVDRIPLIASLGHDLVARADTFSRQVRSRAEFIAYEDLRLHVRSEREIAYYNIGHGHGMVRGRAEGLAGGSSWGAPTRRFAEAVLVAALKARLPANRVVAVLLELAYARVLGLKSNTRGSVQPTKRRTGSPPVSS